MVKASLHTVLGHLRDSHGLTEAPDAELLERFARGHEEAPFAALVRRHGPMVWGVSRRVLSQAHDAEDVFQATFLLLARKAESIRKAGSVGSWLHGVAHRLALRVRLQQTRRRSREKRAADMRLARSARETSLSEVQSALDAALDRVPEKYRTALVLCYLEGLTQAEAARRLGCPLATVRTRVARGRDLLRVRLASHGLALSAAGVAALLIANTAPAAAPAALARAAVKAALAFAAGQPAAGLCSPQAASLIAVGLRTLILSKVRTATVLLLTAGLVAGTAVLMQRGTAAGEATNPPAPPVPPAAAAKSPDERQADPAGSIAYAGRVLGPDGQPVAGARLYLLPSADFLDRPDPSPRYATTDRDGRFHFDAPRAMFGKYQTSALAATADGLGVAWMDVDLRGRKDDLTLRLARDDAPVEGEVVDLQGRPIRGATVRVLHVKGTAADDLRPWLDSVRQKEGRSLPLELKYFPRQLLSPELPDLPRRVVTDAAGRFRLAGIGRDRLVTVRLSGSTIATQDLHILTRPGKPIDVPETAFYPDGRPASFTTYYGAAFRHVAGPTRPIVGVIRDKDTQQPLAGVTVRSYQLANHPVSGLDLVQTRTDTQGRYQLTGMPKGKGNKIMVVPADDQPYLVAAASVPDTPALASVAMDFELKRGVWIEGRLTDKATGKPLQGFIHYLARVGNESVRDYARYEPIDNRWSFNVRPDGTFRVVGLVGPGLLLVSAGDQYLLALERDDAFGTRDLHTQTIPLRVSTDGANALALINPPKGAESFHCDVTVDPGETFTGTIQGPDGQPLTGVRAYRLAPWDGWKRAPLPTASFTVRAFNRRRPRSVFFLHSDRHLVGALEQTGDRTAPVRVRMRPAAAVTGRLVDGDGQPRPGLNLSLGFRSWPWELWAAYFPGQITTDRDGRFRIETLIPGQQYFLTNDGGEIYFGGLLGGLHGAETRSLGDVQLKR